MIWEFSRTFLLVLSWHAVTVAVLAKRSQDIVYHAPQWVTTLISSHSLNIYTFIILKYSFGEERKTLSKVCIVDVSTHIAPSPA